MQITIKSLACIVELGIAKQITKDLKQHRADVAEAKNADYTKEVNGYIDKKFSEKTFLGQPKSMVLMKSKRG